MDWLLNWRKPLEMKYVKLAKELLNEYEFLDSENIILGKIDDDGEYIIPDVYVSNFTENNVKTDKGIIDKGSVFFKREGIIKITLSYYPSLRFMIPKSNLVDFETDQKFIDQDIKVTEWAYNHCYMLPYNKIYENWGRMIFSLFTAYSNCIWDQAPMYKYSPYKQIIEKIKKLEIRNAIQEYNKNTLQKTRGYANVKIRK